METEELCQDCGRDALRAACGATMMETGEKCEHTENEWPPPAGVHEWRLVPTDDREPRVLQWCSCCGSVREVVGTRIDFWIMPSHR